MTWLRVRRSFVSDLRRAGGGLALCAFVFGLIHLPGEGARAQQRGARGIGMQVRTAPVLIRQRGASLADTTIVEMGLRRGIASVDGLRFVHPTDVLAARNVPEAVVEALDELDELARLIRENRANEAAARASAAVEVFEAHLSVVPRSSLLDAYMLLAVANCARGTRSLCVAGFEHVVTVREGARYDEARYPQAYAELFVRTRDLLVTEGKRGELEVRTDPVGAEVFVDGRSYGPSPVLIEGLLAGPHYVTVKAIGHEKVIERVAVEADSRHGVGLELKPTPRALALRRSLSSIREELGQPRVELDSFIAGLGGLLAVNQAIVGTVAPAPGQQISVDLYLYDLRTRFLLNRVMATLPTDAAGIVRARELALELYENVDLAGTVEAPADEGVEPLVTHRSKSIWERWWFWTAVGVVVASGAAAFAIADFGPDVPAGRTRFDTQLQ